jgi:hypothetical protein
MSELEASVSMEARMFTEEPDWYSSSKSYSTPLEWS